MLVYEHSETPSFQTHTVTWDNAQAPRSAHDDNFTQPLLPVMASNLLQGVLKHSRTSGFGDLGQDFNERVEVACFSAGLYTSSQQA